MFDFISDNHMRQSRPAVDERSSAELIQEDTGRVSSTGRGGRGSFVFLHFYFIHNFIYLSCYLNWWGS